METEIVTPAIALLAPSAPLSITTSKPLGTIFCLVGSDVSAIVLALVVASVLRNPLLSRWAASTPRTDLTALLLILCSLTAVGLYPGVNMNPVEELRRCLYSITLGFFALWSATFLLHDLSQSRLVYGLAYALTLSFVPLFRTLSENYSPNGLGGEAQPPSWDMARLANMSMGLS